MCFRRFCADAKRGADLLVRFSLREQLQHLAFAAGQVRGRRHLLRCAAPVLTGALQTLCEIRAAMQQRVNGVDQRVTGIGFQHITAGTGVDEFLYQLIDVVNGECDDFRRRYDALDLPRRLETIHLRHRHIEDDDVGT